MWFIYALTAATFWGLSYAVSERILKTELPVIFYMLLTGVTCVVLSFLISLTQQNSLRTGWHMLTSDKSLLWLSLGNAAMYTIGGYLIYKAIYMKNATYVTLIEITYPLFTLLFAYLLFKDLQLTPITMLGGTLIIFGVAIIYMYS